MSYHLVIIVDHVLMFNSGNLYTNDIGNVIPLVFEQRI